MIFAHVKTRDSRVWWFNLSTLWIKSRIILRFIAKRLLVYNIHMRMQVWILVLSCQQRRINFCLAVNDYKRWLVYIALYVTRAVAFLEVRVISSTHAASSGSSWSTSSTSWRRALNRHWGLASVDDLIESKCRNFDTFYLLGPLCGKSRWGGNILRLIKRLHIFLHLKLPLRLLTVALESVDQISQLLVRSVLYMCHSLDVSHRLVRRRGEPICLLILAQWDISRSAVIITKIYILILDIFVVI